MSVTKQIFGYILFGFALSFAGGTGSENPIIDFTQNYFSGTKVSEFSWEDWVRYTPETGSFLDAHKDASPFSIIVVTHEDISRSGARHLGEALEIFVPGFQYTYNKWNGQIWGMRGISGDQNDKIIVLLNGHKINQQSFQGFSSSLGLMQSISRIEVLQGSAGIVYGSGAIAGVINIITVSPKETRGHFSETTEFTKDGVFGASIEAWSNAQIDSNEFIQVAFGLRQSDGLGDRSGRIFGHSESNLSWQSPSHSKEGSVAGGSPHRTPGNLLASIDWNVGEFHLGFRGSRQQESHGAFFAVDPWVSNKQTILKAKEDSLDLDAIFAPQFIEGRTYTWDGNEHYSQSIGNRYVYVRDQILLAMDYTLDLHKWVDLLVSYNWLGYTSRLETSYDQEAFRDNNRILYSIGERRHEAKALVHFKTESSLQSSFGVEVRRDEIGEDLTGRNTDGGSDASLKKITEVNYHNIALFTESYIPLSSFALSMGLRWDKHTKNSFLSPSLGLVYGYSKDHYFRMMLKGAVNNATAYTFEKRPDEIKGTRYENPLDPNSTVIPAATEYGSLETENIWTLELGSTHHFKNFHVNTSAAFSKVQNLFIWNSKEQRTVNLDDYNSMSLATDSRLALGSFSLGGSHSFDMLLDGPSDSRLISSPGWKAQENGTDLEGKTLYTPVADSANPITHEGNINKESIANYGYFLNNLHWMTTKTYLDWNALTWLGFHTNMRVLWGLKGREGTHDELTRKFESYFLDVDSKPMIKWNFHVMFLLPKEFKLTFMAYDILGEKDNRHSLRWQHQVTKSQADLYSIDQRSFAVKLEKSF